MESQYVPHNETYLAPSGTSMMELFAKIVNRF